LRALGAQTVRYILDHVVINVEDVAAGVSAYRAQLGSHVLAETADEAWLFHGDPVLLRMCRAGPNGIHHLAYKVQDLEAACADLIDKGVQAGSDMAPDGPVRSCSFFDPDGLPFYVFSGDWGLPRPPANNTWQDGTALRLHHVNLLSNDVRPAIEFYRRELGLRVALTYRPDFGGFNFLIDARFDGRTRNFMLEITGAPDLDERESAYLRAHGPSYDHICFITADPVVSYHRLLAGGSSSLYEPENFLDNVLAWVADPHGVHVELMKPLPEALITPALHGRPPVVLKNYQRAESQ
jgi:catechol 2,3-dioxygenase-like lactoylglutathione lyase family enzyme